MAVIVCFETAPKPKDWQFFKNILRYLYKNYSYRQRFLMSISNCSKCKQ